VENFTQGWNWTLCHMENPLQKRIAICRFCTFDAYSSLNIWDSMLERISRTDKFGSE